MCYKGNRCIILQPPSLNRIDVFRLSEWIMHTSSLSSLTASKLFVSWRRWRVTIVNIIIFWLILCRFIDSFRTIQRGSISIRVRFPRRTQASEVMYNPQDASQVMCYDHRPMPFVFNCLGWNGTILLIVCFLQALTRSATLHVNHSCVFLLCYWETRWSDWMVISPELLMLWTCSWRRFVFDFVQNS